MKEIVEKIKTSRILGLVGIGLLVLGVFLPYSKFYFFGLLLSSYPLIKYWEGMVILFLVFIYAMFIFKDYVEKYIPQLFNTNVGKIVKETKTVLATIPMGLILVLLVILHSRLSALTIKYGFGLYVILLGVACSVAFIFLYKKTE